MLLLVHPYVDTVPRMCDVNYVSPYSFPLPQCLGYLSQPIAPLFREPQLTLVETFVHTLIALGHNKLSSLSMALG